MSLQTGGRAIGAISTRSRSASCARRSASAVGTMPTVSPLGPTRRTSGTRIRSLMRSSVLMCPPDGNRGRRSSPAGWARKSTKASACHKRKPVATRLPAGRRITEAVDGLAACTASPTASGPDPTTCVRSMRVGDDACRLRLSDRSCHACRGGHGGTDRSTRDASGSFRGGAESRRRAPPTRAERPARRRGRAGRRPRPRTWRARRRRPPARPRRPGAPPGPRAAAATGTGRASGFQRRSGSVPVNASSASRPSAPCSSTAAMSLVLSWASPASSCSTSPSTATTGTSSRGVLQRGERVGVAARVRGVRRQRGGHAGDASPVSPANGASGMRRSGPAERSRRILARPRPGGRLGPRRGPEVPSCTGVWDAGGVDDVTWGALTLTLTLLGGIWTWCAFRRRGLASGLRGAGFTLLPAGGLADRHAASCSPRSSARSATGPPAWCSTRSTGSGSCSPGSRWCCSASPASCPRASSAAGRTADARASCGAGKRAAPGGPPPASGAPADRRRHGRDRGDPAQARHLLMAHSTPSTATGCGRGSNDAVAAHPEPARRPRSMVVDLDAFDANADDLVRRAGGKPIRVASKSLRVPGAARAGAGARRLPRRAGLHPARGAVAARARASATTSSSPTRPSTGPRWPGWSPRPSAAAHDHADGRRRRPTSTSSTRSAPRRRCRSGSRSTSTPGCGWAASTSGPSARRSTTPTTWSRWPARVADRARLPAGRA